MFSPNLIYSTLPIYLPIYRSTVVDTDESQSNPIDNRCKDTIDTLPL